MIISKKRYSTQETDRVETKDGGSFYGGTKVMSSIRAFEVFKTKDESANQNPDQKIPIDEEYFLRVGTEILRGKS